MPCFLNILKIGIAHRSLLHTASGSGHEDMVAFLLTKGAHSLVNEADDEANLLTNPKCLSFHVPSLIGRSLKCNLGENYSFVLKVYCETGSAHSHMTRF